MEQENKPLMLTISSPSEILLNEFKSSMDADNVEFGNVSRIKQGGDLNFDPITASTVAYKIIGVIGTVGGTVQFIDWLVEKLKTKYSSNKMIIKFGETSITISNPENLTDEEIDSIINKIKKEIQSK